MAEKTDEIEIEVDTSVAEPNKDGDKAPPIVEKTIVTPEQGIEELRAQLDAERKGRQDAETRAAHAAQQATAAKTETDDTNLKLLTNAIATVKNNQVILKQNYAAAMAANKFDDVAEINLQMAATVHDLKRMEIGEKTYRERAKQPPSRPATDPVEAYAIQLPPRSAAWVRSHPDYARDPKLNRKMIRAHEDAIDEGIAAETDEYFRAVEDKLGLFGAKHEIIVPDPMKEAAQVTQRRSSPPAAPVSRGTLNGSKPNTVRLSADEREMARMMDMSDQDYAKSKLALIKDGKLRQ